MAAFSWVRSWHGAPTDNKYLVIAARAKVKTGVVSAVMWALLDYASQHEVRGTVEGFDTETYAAFSGFDEVEIIAIIEAMTAKNIIKDGRLTNWEKRQPKREDDSTARVTKFREMKRSVTQGNAPEKRREDKDKEEVGGASPPNDDIPDTPYKDLEVAFVGATGMTIPVGGGSATGKWIESLRKMKSAGATPDDIHQVIQELADKNYTILGPSSIVKGVQNVLTKRHVKNNRRPKSTGKYSEVHE